MSALGGEHKKREVTFFFSLFLKQCQKVLTPPAADAPNSSLAHMFATVKGAFGAPDSAWLGAHDDSGAWAIDPDACLAFLESAVADQRPVVLLGTAFLFVHLIDSLQAAGRRFALPDGSRVMETGGYKGRSRELSREELHRLTAQYLGVEIGSILREYGMSELSSQAYARADRAFQFPPWARATRSPSRSSPACCCWPRSCASP